jgi:hypothetical protein
MKKQKLTITQVMYYLQMGNSVRHRQPDGEFYICQKGLNYLLVFKDKSSQISKMLNKENLEGILLKTSGDKPAEYNIYEENEYKMKFTNVILTKNNLVPFIKATNSVVTMKTNSFELNIGYADDRDPEAGFMIEINKPDDKKAYIVTEQELISYFEDEFGSYNVSFDATDRDKFNFTIEEMQEE